MNWCVVVPTYNNYKTIKEVLTGIQKITMDIIVVNDGSTDDTLNILREFDNIEVINLAKNKGKGYALRQAFEYAFEQGFEYAVTIDADGQHYPSDINLFLDFIPEGNVLVTGDRNINQQKLSKGSSFANRFSNFWFRFLTSYSLPDTQSGFRLYPLESVNKIKWLTYRYEFELEVLVRCAWKGVKLKSIPVNVYYPPSEERVSHFRPVKDFLRISALYTILVIIAVLYVKPFYFIKFLNKKNISDFIKNQIIQTRDSQAKTTLSVMFGVFMGVVPIWGYQLVTAIALAYLLKLNKFVVAVASNISIPPMIPFILFASYVTGGFILGAENVAAFNPNLTFDFVKENLFQYVVGSMVFAIILSICFGMLTIMLLKFGKRKPLLKEK